MKLLRTCFILVASLQILPPRRLQRQKSGKKMETPRSIFHLTTVFRDRANPVVLGQELISSADRARHFSICLHLPKALRRAIKSLWFEPCESILSSPSTMPDHLWTWSRTVATTHPRRKPVFQIATHWSSRVSLCSFYVRYKAR